MTIERLDPPSSARDARTLDAARRRAVDALAGRTVWCATALPTRQASAQRLCASLQWGGGGAAGGLLEVAGDERLRELAERLQAMLEGASRARFGAAEREICADGLRASEDLVGPVSPDDVVVAHDTLTALLAEAVRDRGAHAVWNVGVVASPWPANAAESARSFLRRYTFGIDAYVTTWSAPAERPGAVVERIAALMPCADAVAARDVPATVASGEPRLLAWSSVLAEVVHSDRDETVGGTLHPRPSVAVR